MGQNEQPFIVEFSEVDVVMARLSSDYEKYVEDNNLLFTKSMLCTAFMKGHRVNLIKQIKLGRKRIGKYLGEVARIELYGVKEKKNEPHWNVRMEDNEGKLLGFVNEDFHQHWN